MHCVLKSIKIKRKFLFTIKFKYNHGFQCNKVDGSDLAPCTSLRCLHDQYLTSKPDVKSVGPWNENDLVPAKCKACV